MNEYASLRNRLRQEAQEWCVNCCYRGGDCICTAPDDRKKDCDIYTKLQAADAIEALQGQLSVCLEGTKVRFLKNDDGTKEIRFENLWIPVTERLPEKEKKSYLCRTDGGYHCEVRWTDNKYGLRSGGGGEWGWSIFDIPQYSKVTHWMPLPEPPKEE